MSDIRLSRKIEGRTIMNKLVVMCLILSLASPLFAVPWKDGDWEDQAFVKHYLGGIIVSQVGYDISSLFFDKQEHFIPKVLCGVVFCAGVMITTRQEWEPDGRAMNIGCYHWVGGRLLLFVTGAIIEDIRHKIEKRSK